MKRTFKTIIRTLTGTALFIANAYAEGNTTPDAKTSMRETLIESATIERVYAVDERHTLVIGQDAVLYSAKGLTVVKEFKRGEIAAVEAYLLKHDEPQPFVIKNPAIGESGRLTSPTAERLHFGSLINAADTYVEIDLAQEAITECGILGGTTAFVIPRRSGKYERLASADAATAFDYIIGSAGQDNAWFAACTADAGFLVEKYYGHRTTQVKTAGFFPGRTLAGVNYVKEAAAPVESSVEAEYNPAEHERVRKDTAREVASMKMDFVKPLENVKYTGIYNGEYKNTGCGHVTVKVTGRLNLRNTLQAKAYDFKVCDNKVAFLGENNSVETKHMYATYTK